jgi:hypothetical protein
LRPRDDMVASSLRFGSGELDHRYRKKGVLPPPISAKRSQFFRVLENVD